MHNIELVFDGECIPMDIVHGCPDHISDEISRLNPDRVLVISDNTVLDRCGEALLPLLRDLAPLHVISGPGGEGLKTLPHLTSCLEEAIAAGVSRRSIVVGFGGGVVGNLAGLVAALLFRGLRLVHVPTTFLAMHDSVLSLKQAVNSASGKNLIGCFHAPTRIIADTRFLDTLPNREWRSGLVETIKNALTLQPKMIPRLEQILTPSLDISPANRAWLLEASLAAKLERMAQDRYEKKAALVLEYGHTVGHAIEYASTTAGTQGPISHGEAVGLGMLVAAQIGAETHGLPAADVDLHRALLARIGAPLEPPADLPTPDIIAMVAKDNKRGYIRLSEGQVAMVLLRRTGEPAGESDLPLVPVDLSLVERTLRFVPARPRNEPWEQPVDVYMVTCGQRSTAEAALQSVLGQRYNGPITLWVFEDDTTTARAVCESLERPDNVALEYRSVPAPPGRTDAHPLHRVARLRNHAIGFGSAPLVAFIDDDNLWAPNHLASLSGALWRNGALAAHSWRLLIDAAGRAVIPERFVWRHPADPTSATRFAIYRKTGVFSANDAIVRDRVSLVHEGEEFGMVDMGEWLLRRSVFDDYRFDEDYSPDEIAVMVGEDDKLLTHLRAASVGTVCTEQATLSYRLGGFSNAWAG